MSLVEELKGKTVFELKAYAKKNGIDLYGTKTKVEILETIFNFVPLEEFSGDYKEKQEKKESKDSGEKVAVYSSRNLFWSGVGELTQGYNIVSKEASENWITHKAVRIATPEEVASYYDKK
jgi:hypothetical protein